MPRRKNEEIAAALQQTRGMVAVAAKKLGIARKTVYRRLEKSPKLREVLEDAREETGDVAELKLFQAIQAGEPWAVKYYLDTQGRKRGYGQKVDVTTREAKEYDLTQATDEQLERIRDGEDPAKVLGQ